MRVILLQYKESIEPCRMTDTDDLHTSPPVCYIRSRKSWMTTIMGAISALNVAVRVNSHTADSHMYNPQQITAHEDETLQSSSIGTIPCGIPSDFCCGFRCSFGRSSVADFCCRISILRTQDTGEMEQIAIRGSRKAECQLLRSGWDLIRLKSFSVREV